MEARAVLIWILIISCGFTKADDPFFGVSNLRSAQLFRGMSVPGNSVGNAAQFVPGVALPNQERRFPDQVPFSPTTHVFGNTVNVNNGNSWGYGQVLHGVNPLDMDVRSLDEAYVSAASQPPIKTDGQSFPFDSVVNVGGEYDAQKWKYMTGGLKIPVLSERWPNLFDLNGHVQAQKGAGVLGNVDFPVVGTDERFPLSGTLSYGKLVTTAEFGQAIPNVNPFKLSREQIMNQLVSGANPNPTFLGRRKREVTMRDVVSRGGWVVMLVPTYQYVLVRV